MSASIFSANQARQQVNRAVQAQQRLLYDIKVNSSQDSARRAHAARHEYLRSGYVKLSAASKALHGRSRRCTLAAAIDLATRVNCWSYSHEPVLIRNVRKLDGSIRQICKFGPQRKAQQIIVADILRASFEAPSWQYEHRGRGHNAAVKRVLDVVTRGKPFVTYLDIRACFESFDRGRIIEILPLPSAVILHNVLLDDRASPIRRYANSMHIHNRCPQLRGGLPQGSAVSNLVASFLLRNLDDALVGTCELVSFRDDIVVLGETRSEVDESSASLREALRNHPAGVLEVGRHLSCYADDGFDYLGYTIQRRAGQTTARPTESKLEEMQIDFALNLIRDVDEFDHRLTKTLSFLARMADAFPLWDALPFISEKVAFAQDCMADHLATYDYRGCSSLV